MIIQVRVIPGAKRDRIKKETWGWRVHLTAPPEKGKANKALKELLAECFKVKKKQVIINQGLKSKNKLVEII